MVKVKDLKVTSIVPNGVMSTKWFILHDPVGNLPERFTKVEDDDSKSSCGWEVFIGPIYYGLAAAYITDVKKGCGGSGQFVLVEVKEFITVQEN